jgi:hypothetical protein
LLIAARPVSDVYGVPYFAITKSPLEIPRITAAAVRGSPRECGAVTLASHCSLLGGLFPLDLTPGILPSLAPILRYWNYLQRS